MKYKPLHCLAFRPDCKKSSIVLLDILMIFQPFVSRFETGNLSFPRFNPGEFSVLNMYNYLTPQINVRRKVEILDMYNYLTPQNNVRRMVEISLICLKGRYCKYGTRLKTIPKHVQLVLEKYRSIFVGNKIAGKNTAIDGKIRQLPALNPCQVPLSHVPDYVLPALWHVVYWSSQFLTW
jgi:hypothetical protein